MRLGIFLPNWIGDVAMATPALRALRKHVGPESRIFGIMRPYVAEVLSGTDWLDECFFYSKRPNRRELKASAVISKMRAARLDAVVLLTNSIRTAWMAWRSGARERIGYEGDLRSWLLTTRLYEPRRGLRKHRLPTIDSYLNLAYAFGCVWEPPQLELATTQSDEQLADEFWERRNLPAGERVVTLNTGGAFGAAKDWPIERFASLAGQIAADWNLHVVVNCGPSERETGRAIVAQAQDRRVISLADEPRLPIGLSKAVIRRSRLLVTTDSGPRFFAVAFGVPVVTLFGPTDTRTTRTHYAHETCLSLGLECQPCEEPTCPLIHHRCMRDLSVPRVYEAVARQLETEPVQETAAA